jgi:hypothetical protein
MGKRIRDDVVVTIPAFELLIDTDYLAGAVDDTVHDEIRKVLKSKDMRTRIAASIKSELQQFDLQPAVKNALKQALQNAFGGK